MANPIFDNSPVFQDPVQRKGQKPSPTGGVTYATTGAAATDAASLEALYGSPAATTRDTGRMTYDDVIIRTEFWILLGLILVVRQIATAEARRLQSRGSDETRGYGSVVASSVP